MSDTLLLSEMTYQVISGCVNYLGLLPWFVAVLGLLWGGVNLIKAKETAKYAIGAILIVAAILLAAMLVLCIVLVGGKPC